MYLVPNIFEAIITKKLTAIILFTRIYAYNTRHELLLQN